MESPPREKRHELYYLESEKGQVIDKTMCNRLWGRGDGFHGEAVEGIGWGLHFGKRRSRMWGSNDPGSTSSGEETHGSRDPEIINEGTHRENRGEKRRLWGLRSAGKAVSRPQEAPQSQAKAFLLLPRELTPNRNNSMQGRLATKGPVPITI